MNYLCNLFSNYNYLDLFVTCVLSIVYKIKEIFRPSQCDLHIFYGKPSPQLPGKLVGLSIKYSA